MQTSRIAVASCSARSGSPVDRLVVEHERMQVAVAGVEDARDPQPVLGRELGGAAQHLGQLRPRHDAVLDVVARGDPAHRGERRLAAAPDPRALLGGLGGMELEGAELRGRSRSTAAESSATCAAGPSSSTISTAPAPAG